MDFTNRHVVVTGASSGIGLVTAKRIAAAGGKVTLMARRAEELQRACEEIGPNAAFAVADVASKAQLEAALDSAVYQHGPIHGMFANAGLTGGFTPAVQFDSDVFEQTIKSRPKVEPR